MNRTTRVIVASVIIGGLVAAGTVVAAGLAPVATGPTGGPLSTGPGPSFAAALTVNARMLPAWEQWNASNLTLDIYLTYNVTSDVLYAGFNTTVVPHAFTKTCGTRNECSSTGVVPLKVTRADPVNLTAPWVVGVSAIPRVSPTAGNHTYGTFSPVAYANGEWLMKWSNGTIGGAWPSQPAPQTIDDVANNSLEVPPFESANTTLSIDLGGSLNTTGAWAAHVPLGKTYTMYVGENGLCATLLPCFINVAWILSGVTT